jgi:hypothetical protein
MIKCRILIAVVLAIAFWTGPLFSQETVLSPSASGLALKAGLSGEYFARTMGWDEDTKAMTSTLKTYLALAHVNLQLREGFDIAVLAGYASSDTGGVLYKNLPFSIDYEGGGISGYLLGAEACKSLFTVQDFEISAFAQFVSYTGTEKTWEIPGLAVTGTVEFAPSWTRLSLGPIVAYKGFLNFTPYFSIQYNRLAGTFEMRQTVQTLAGIEKKAVKAKSPVAILLGCAYALTGQISLIGEAGIMPYKSHLDSSFMLKAQISFK